METIWAVEENQVRSFVLLTFRLVAKSTPCSRFRTDQVSATVPSSKTGSIPLDGYHRPRLSP